MLAGGGADQLLLEARDEAAGAERDLAVLAAGAGDFPVADPCPRHRRRGYRRSRPGARPARICAAARRSARSPRRSPPPAPRRPAARCRDRQSSAPGSRAGPRPSILYSRSAPSLNDTISTFGGKRRPQIVLADRLGRAALHRALQHLAQHRRAVALAQDLHRHLAGAEARQANSAAEFVEAIDDLVLELVGRNDDAEFALEPVGAGFGHLHSNKSTWSGVTARQPLGTPSWFRPRDPTLAGSPRSTIIPSWATASRQ